MSLFDDIIISGDQFSKVFGSYIPALIALIGTAATIYFNKKTSNENRKANEEIAEKQRLLQLDLNTKQQEFQNEIRNLNEKHLTDLKNRELAANIIAKQRIDWLDKVRLLTGEYIKYYHAIMDDLMYSPGMEKHRDNLEQYNLYFYLLLLYYPLLDREENENLDHKKIVQKLMDLDGLVNEQFLKHRDLLKKPANEMNYIDISELDDTLFEFVNESSIYFKQVWKEAKNMN